MQDKVGAEISDSQPERNDATVFANEAEHFVIRVADSILQATGHVSAVNVRKDDDRVVGAPDETAEKEGAEQEDAVVELEAGSGEVELVAEPVDIQEWRGKLVQDECWRVEVDEWSL